MANNIFAGYPNVCHGLTNVDFVTAGVTAENIALIVRMAQPLKSYVPGKLINTITGFETGYGYYLIPLQDIDLTNIVAPPWPQGASEDGILLEDGNPIILG